MIENKDELKDLGIIFDSKMTFSRHIEEVLIKSTRISALSFKFAKELRTPSLHIKIIFTYLVPILEYVSIICFPQKKPKIKAMERCSCYTTRRYCVGVPVTIFRIICRTINDS